MEKEYKFGCVMDDGEYVQSCKKDLYGRLNDIKIEALDLSQKAEKAMKKLMKKLMKIQTKNDMKNFMQEIIDIDDDLYRISVNKL